MHFISPSNTFDEMLERAIDYSGDENYCAVLAGSLGGARWRASSVSDIWFFGVSDLKRIESIASNLVMDW